MANVLVEESNLSNIAQAIRGQNGGVATYKPSEMAAAISNLPVTSGTQASEDILIQGNFSNYSYENDRVTTYRTSVFSNLDQVNYRVESVSLPNLTYIYDGTFRENLYLKQVNLPKVQKIIGSYTFHIVSNVTSLSFPELEWIQGTNTFSCNSKLTSIEFPLLNGGELDHTFWNCTNLTSINLSNFWGNNEMRSDGTDYHMGVIGPYTFYGCSNLASIQFSTNKSWSISKGIGLFEDCESLTSLDLSMLHLGIDQNSVVGESMFDGCTNLSNITFDQDCIEFTQTYYMFSGCKALTKLKLPNMPITWHTFSATPNLKTLIFDDINIGLSSDPYVPLENSFSNCFSNSGMLEDDAYIYVPKAYLSHYQTATNWVTVANKFRAIEDYPDITGG